LHRGFDRFERIFDLLAEERCNEYIVINDSIVRAHQYSAGAQKRSASRWPIPRRAKAQKSTRSPTPSSIPTP
jgi:hypothetical protein